MSVANLIQVALFVLLPPATLLGARRYRAMRAIGPVLSCYCLGVLLGNQPLLPFDLEIDQNTGAFAIALAIPLMLFSLDIGGWLRLARSTLISFGLAVVSVLVMATVGGLLFAGRVEDSAEIAGMLVGVYTGGTPNMAAIGFSLGVDSEVFGMLNVADMILGACYLMFLFWAAARVFGLLLPPFARQAVRSELPPSVGDRDRPTWRSAPLALGLAIAVVALATGVYLIAPGGFEWPFAILTITTLAVAASLSRRVRNLPGTYSLGQYFLLVFCVAIGAQAEFRQLLHASGDIFLFTLLVMFGAIVLHLLLASLLRIDRDTMIITSTAAIYGPAFVIPVAEAIRNREVVLSGIATGLVGYAVANYLGLGLAWLLG